MLLQSITFWALFLSVDSFSECWKVLSSRQRWTKKISMDKNNKNIPIGKGTVFQTEVSFLFISPETSSRVTLASLGTVFQTAHIPTSPPHTTVPTAFTIGYPTKPPLCQRLLQLDTQQSRHCADGFYHWMPAAILPRKLSYFPAFASRQNRDIATCW